MPHSVIVDVCPENPDAVWLKGVFHMAQVPRVSDWLDINGQICNVRSVTYMASALDAGRGVDAKVTVEG